MFYEDTANELVQRIKALIPSNPSILKLDSAWGLFKIPGFKSDDLQPSLAQASWALGKAVAEYNADERRKKQNADMPDLTRVRWND